MMNRIDMGSPDALLLAHALEKLRARDGLTHARLINGQRGDAAALLRLGAVRRFAAVHQIPPEQAAVEVIRECVRENLDDSDRIVADAVLGLGSFTEAYARYRIDQRVISALSSDLLGRRRTALLTHWRDLHRALRVDPTDPPSDRSLRGTVEPAMLAELARQLIRREVFSFGAKNAPAVTAGDDGGPAHPAKVIVIGGAVMDAKFRTKSLPSVGMSAEALSFQLAPGGKGLNQAVAAARLGNDVALVAAVARDRFGMEIVEHLHDEGVDTSLIKWVDDSRTPFTAVVELELGDSLAVNWPNRDGAQLEPRDLECLNDRLPACDALLVTFEVPRRTLECALTMVGGVGKHRPLVIVTPGQPYDTAISGQSLSQIDFLVAHEWELGQYAPPDRDLFDVDAAARRLLAYGVEHLCVPNSGGCNIYSEQLGTFSVPTFPSPYKEQATARDAFCAALAAKLIESEGRFSEDAALWATAAMAAATADHPLPNPLPDRRRVQQLLERSRFAVNPRYSQVSDAAERPGSAEWIRSLP
jgi:ribokinase